ncbi:ABC transporter [Roseateles aquatilis]|uniref:Cyclolysin secretion/processing ATP-binding protein CyaB n=1 Tax=Roseateles aquatilis TaxID=431061 RepID=A0A246JI48_9BURK|nr:ABC transporter [Roseateles aquatilis]
MKLQGQASECGLACLAMISSHFGQDLTLSDLRRRFPTSVKGATLQQLIQYATSMGISARAVRLEVEEVKDLKLPCILHWGMKHFVVLERVYRGGRSAVVLDPAVGRRKVSLSDMSRDFTGVALECVATAEFKPADAPRRVSIKSLTGKVVGVKRSLAQILCVALVLELFAIVSPLINQTVVDDVLTSGNRDLLTVLLLGFGLLLIIQTVVGITRSWMVMILGQTLSLQWAGNVFSHLIRLPVDFFEKRHLGDISSRFAAVGAIQKVVTVAAIEALIDGIMVIGAFAMMVIYAPSLAVITVLAVSAYTLVRVATFSAFREAAAERLVMSAKESSHFLETLRAVAPLRLFGRESQRTSIWQNLIVDVQNRDVRTAKLGILYSTANTFIFGVENLLVLWFGARLIMGEPSAPASLTVGMLLAYVSYKGQFTGRVTALVGYISEVKMLSLHSERLTDIVLEAPESVLESIRDLGDLKPEIELRNICFRYSPNDPWLLRDASLRIEAGEVVAIVGRSGAGKTTLLKIILGILKPTEGEVLYGGIPIEHLGLNNYRAQIGAVMQEDTLLSGSVGENISFFDGEFNQERIEDCAKVVQIHEDIVHMPMGYQTLVGDMGAGLSGGQKQRILFARALYKLPRVLVLDEATSHLDAQREHELSAALSALPLTRLIVAHRLETIAVAQRVVVVEGGRINSRPEQRDLTPSPMPAKLSPG